MCRGQAPAAVEVHQGPRRNRYAAVGAGAGGGSLGDGLSSGTLVCPYVARHSAACLNARRTRATRLAFFAAFTAVRFRYPLSHFLPSIG